ncbi:MAG: two component signal transduction system hybrid histidine kinase / response regulator [Phormidium sp. OSCR]|nr:MAG: two component signal transduction system hybrid histidine kinase / response regulator [Phormidium sp. OSCR]
MVLQRLLQDLSQRLPLRTVLIIPFALQIFAAVGLTGYLSFRNGQEAVDELAQQLQAEISLRIEERLENYLSQAHLINQTNIMGVRLNTLDLTNLDQLDRHFAQQIRLFDAVSYIYFANPQGAFSGAERVPGGTVNIGQAGRTGPNDDQFYTYATNERGEPTQPLSAVPDYDALTRPWYLDAIGARSPQWGEVYVWDAPYHNLALPTAQAVYDAQGELLGVFAVDLSLLDISTFLGKLEVGKTGETFIVDQQGQLIATSTSDPPFSEDDTNPTRLYASESSNDLIQETASYLLGELGGFVRVDDIRQERFTLEGESHLVQVRPFEDEWGLNWSIVVVIPEGDFMERIHANTRNTLLLCGLALVISTAIGAVTARWVVSPLQQLKESAQALSQGQWQHPVPEHRHDEIGDLARSFRRMATQLQEYFRDLQAKNEQMQRLDKLKDEFLANTSHELRTPLNGTIGIAESLLDGVAGPLNPAQQNNLSLIIKSCYRLNTLVNDILDFSKLRHKQIHLQPQPVGLREIVESVLNLCQSLVSRKNVQLINAISPQLPWAYADENRLQQILYNLVGNAIKFTEEGFVGISAIYSQESELQTTNSADRLGLQLNIQEDSTLAAQESMGGYLLVTVSDTGIGIPADKHQSIFESFEQADGSTSRDYGGTGLGLAVTKQLVELHGGTLTVQSIVGKGSQFTFSLPVVTPEQLAASQMASPTQVKPMFAEDGSWDDEVSAVENNPRLLGSSPDTDQVNPEVENPGLRSSLTHPEVQEPITSDLLVSQTTSEVIVQIQADNREDVATILIVDDEAINLQVLVNHLSLENYVITQAVNGLEALEMIENGLKPDLVILDVMMPKMTGYEVTQKLRETYSAHELPILLLTAKNRSEDIVVGLQNGANDYLTKPVNKRELLARLKTHLKLSRLSLAYAKFVPKEFLEFLDKSSIIDVQLGDTVEREMSILFSDIRDFTKLSEGMKPEDNFKFINGYLSRMEPAILDNHGFIDKYIGDAIMALFGGTADDAVKAAIAMLNNLDTYNQSRQRPGRRPIKIGIGINTGQLMLGTVGGKKHMNSTAISDAVNLASRVEGLTKVYGVPLLIAEETFIKLQNTGDYNIRLIDRVLVKGKSQKTSIFEVFDADPEPVRSGKLATRTQFELGLAYLQGQKIQEAQDLFLDCLAQNPADYPAKIYLERCQKLRETTEQSST